MSRPVLILFVSALVMLGPQGGPHDVAGIVHLRVGSVQPVRGPPGSGTRRECDTVGRQRDSFASDKMAQVYAYVGTTLALGPIVGPIFGGVIEVTAGWCSVVICLAAFGCLMLLTIVFLLRETNTNLNRDATRPARLIGNYATLLSTRLYMGYVLCNAICYGGIFAFTSCSAYILIGLLQVSPDVFGALYAVTVSAYGVGTLVASQITRRVGINRMIVYGGLIMTILGEIGVILPMLGYFDIWTVILPFAGFAFGTSFVFPSGQAGGISPYPKMAGAASSMLSCPQMATAAVIGTVYQHGCWTGP